MIKLKLLIVNLIIPLGVGGISAWLTGDSMEVYKGVRQPPLSPPGWVFPVVWTILFTLMGIAAYIVFMKNSESGRRALVVYGVQLAVNFVWPLLFFSAQWFAAAFYWLIGLWLLIALTLVLFYKESRVAGLLLIPYLLWVSFAAYLNFGVWVLNR